MQGHSEEISVISVNCSAAGFPVLPVVDVLKKNSNGLHLPMSTLPVNSEVSPIALAIALRALTEE